MAFFRRSAAWAIASLGLLCGACGEGAGADSGGDAGVLRDDAVVLYVGDDDLHSLGFLDAVRDGDTIYLLINVDEFPSLFVSEDAGDTWARHQLPPSYDKVEGIEDGYPGHYRLYPWQGHLYLVVSATTVTQGASYGAVAEVDLVSNDYALRANRFLDGRIHFGKGLGLEASSQVPSQGIEYGNVDWQQYDFATDTVTARGSIPLAGSGLEPRDWASADGRELVTAIEKQLPDGSLEFCRVSLDITTGGSALTAACMPRGQAPFGNTGQPEPYMDSDVSWITELAGHTFRVRLKPEGDDLKATAIDLGPGTAARSTFNGPRRSSGDFLIVPTMGEDNMTVQPRPRLIHMTEDDQIEDVDLPWTPCEGGTTCGFGEMGLYGTVRWIVPMDDGNVLVFHVVGKSSDGTPQIVVMTREHPTLRPASFEPAELGMLPSRPGLKPAPLAVQQCVRAVACGYHPNLAECQQYWSIVRRGLDGTDTAYAAFVDVPPGPCSAFEDVYTDRRDPARLTPCQPGCDGDWATLSCQLPVRENCAARGVPCRLDALGQGICADRELTPANCDTCDGDFAINCSGSQMPTVTDCSLTGQQCHVFADAPNPSRASCTPGACESDELSSCSGDVLNACWPNDPTISSELDCGRMIEGTACAPNCITYSQMIQCEGDLLLYRVGPASFYVDCKAIGFRTCEPTLGSDSAGCVR